MRSSLVAVCEFTERAVRLVLALLILLVVVITLLAVFTRYVLNDPLAWTEQVSRILFVWMTFLGTAVLYRRRLHITIDFVLYALPPALRRPIAVVNELLMLLLFGVLLVFGLRLALDTVGQTFGALDISPSTFYFAAPVAAALLILYWLEHLLAPPGDAERPSGSTLS